MSTLTNTLTSAVTGALGAAAVLILAPVELQGSTPGSKQNGNINVSGSVLAGKVGVGTNTPAGQVGVATTDNVTGVHSRTGGIGVLGQSNRPGIGYGGFFSASGASSRGIFGESTSSVGTSVGGEFVTRCATGFGVLGRNTDQGIAVRGVGGVGVKGEGTIAGQFVGTNTGLEAVCSESGSPSRRAINALNTSANTGGQLGSSFGGVYSFDIVVATYRDRNNQKTPRPISPVAFGTVATNGNVSGSDNVLVIFNGATKKWEIIPRAGTELANCAVIITPFNSGITASAKTSGQKAIVDLRNGSNAFSDSGFSFIIMDTGPAPLK